MRGKFWFLECSTVSPAQGGAGVAGRTLGHHHVPWGFSTGPSSVTLPCHKPPDRHRHLAQCTELLDEQNIIRDDCFFFVRPHRTQRLCPCSATSAQPAAQPSTPMTSFDASTLRTPPSSSASWSKAGSGLRIQHTQSVSKSLITTQAAPSLALPIVCVGHGCDPSHAGKSDTRTHTHTYVLIPSQPYA